jgi:hypothetical protein
MCLAGLALVELGANSYGSFPHANHRPQENELTVLAGDGGVAAAIAKTQARTLLMQDDRVYNFGDFHGLDTWHGYAASIPAGLWKRGLHTAETMELYGVQYLAGSKPFENWSQPVAGLEHGLTLYRNPVVGKPVWVERGKVRQTDGVWLLRREGGEVQIYAEMEKPGTVVVADNYFPGWEAKSNGSAVEVKQVDGTLRGVELGAGRQMIEMRYRPRGVGVGMVMSVLGIVVGLALMRLDRKH